ncbi:hypothetical protein NL676_005223 [Syzygium grande]|nr:hypothetical protein NL676_005223 [Syzygium grande]
MTHSISSHSTKHPLSLSHTHLQPGLRLAVTGQVEGKNTGSKIFSSLSFFLFQEQRPPPPPPPSPSFVAATAEPPGWPSRAHGTVTTRDLSLPSGGGALSTPKPYSQEDKLLTLLRQRKTKEASSSRLLKSTRASQSASNEGRHANPAPHLGKNLIGGGGSGKGAEVRRGGGTGMRPWYRGMNHANDHTLYPLASEVIHNTPLAGVSIVP